MKTTDMSKLSVAKRAEIEHYLRNKKLAKDRIALFTKYGVADSETLIKLIERKIGETLEEVRKVPEFQREAMRLAYKHYIPKSSRGRKAHA